MGAAPRSALTVVTGQDLISTYTWNTHEAQHYFCKVCGIYTHHVMRGQIHTVGLNMGCIEGFDVSVQGGVQMEDGKSGWSVAKDNGAA